MLSRSVWALISIHPISETIHIEILIIQFPKHQFTSVAQVDERVKDHMHCYFTHTINPDLMYAVHAAKGLPRKVIY